MSMLKLTYLHVSFTTASMAVRDKPEAKPDEEPIFINSEQITWMQRDRKQPWTNISVPGYTFRVQESMDDILRQMYHAKLDEAKP